MHKIRVLGNYTHIENHVIEIRRAGTAFLPILFSLHWFSTTIDTTVIIVSCGAPRPPSSNEEVATLGGRDTSWLMALIVVASWLVIAVERIEEQRSFHQRTQHIIWNMAHVKMKSRLARRLTQNEIIIIGISMYIHYTIY